MFRVVVPLASLLALSSATVFFEETFGGARTALRLRQCAWCFLGTVCLSGKLSCVPSLWSCASSSRRPSVPFRALCRWLGEPMDAVDCKGGSWRVRRCRWYVSPPHAHLCPPARRGTFVSVYTSASCHHCHVVLLSTPPQRCSHASPLRRAACPRTTWHVASTWRAFMCQREREGALRPPTHPSTCTHAFPSLSKPVSIIHRHHAPSHSPTPLPHPSPSSFPILTAQVASRLAPTPSSTDSALDSPSSQTMPRTSMFR
jgi:hypothetical protein